MQQRAGVQLSGGVGAAGDRYEQNADAVADRLVAGRSADDLLDQVAPAGAAGGGVAAVQRKSTIVDEDVSTGATGPGLLKQTDGSIHPTVRSGGLVGECATEVEAFLIPMDDMGGSVPKSGTWPSWWAAAAPNPNNYWVRGHLLNENLGGPGEQRNLTPITKATNSAHHALVEKAAKLAIETGNALYYKVVAN